jgi:hypothetical protein
MMSALHPAGAVAERKLKALSEAQMVLGIKMSIWLRAPSKQSRADLEEAMSDFEDVFDRIICPRKDRSL